MGSVTATVTLTSTTLRTPAGVRYCNPILARTLTVPLTVPMATGAGETRELTASFEVSASLNRP